SSHTKSFKTANVPSSTTTNRPKSSKLSRALRDTDPMLSNGKTRMGGSPSNEDSEAWSRREGTPTSVTARSSIDFTGSNDSRGSLGQITNSHHMVSTKRYKDENCNRHFFLLRPRLII